jgi:flagellar basal body-associated protein FliL
MKDKKVLAGGAVLVLALFWFYIKPHYMDPKPAPVYTEEQLAAAPKPTVKLEERVLNLKAPPTAPNYVKTAIALQFTDPKHTYLGAKGAAIDAKDLAYTDELKPDMPRVWDAIIQVVGGRSADQVSTTEGRDKLKADLVDAINKQLDADHKVQAIYFVTFITQ